MRTEQIFRHQKKYRSFTNLLLGLFLWFLLSSDFCWNNVWMDVLFAPVVGILGWRSYSKFKEGLSQKQKRIHRLYFLPSILGGIPYLIVLFVAIFSPLLLATAFWVSEEMDKTKIQEVASPDGNKIVEVYFLPVGAYSGGNGRIEVFLKYKWIPFVKRDIFYLRVSRADENSRNYVSWVDDTKLHISETGTDIEISWIRWKIPTIIRLPISLIHYLIFERSVSASMRFNPTLIEMKAEHALSSC